MNELVSCELDLAELRVINGGKITSAELYLVSGLFLCAVNPVAAAAVAIATYANTRAIEHIEY